MSFANCNNYRSSAKASPPRLRPSTKRNRPQDALPGLGAPTSAPFAWAEHDSPRKRQASEDDEPLAQASAVEPPLVAADAGVHTAAEPTPAPPISKAAELPAPAPLPMGQDAASSMDHDTAASNSSAAHWVMAPRSDDAAEPVAPHSDSTAQPAAAGRAAAPRDAANLFGWAGEGAAREKSVPPERAPASAAAGAACMAGRAAGASRPATLFAWACEEEEEKPAAGRAHKEARAAPARAAGAPAGVQAVPRSARVSEQPPWASDPSPRKAAAPAKKQAAAVPPRSAEQPPLASTPPKPKATYAASPSPMPAVSALGLAPEALLPVRISPARVPTTTSVPVQLSALTQAAPSSCGRPAPSVSRAASERPAPAPARPAAASRSTPHPPLAAAAADSEALCAASRSLISLFLAPLYRALTPRGVAVSAGKAAASLRGFGASADVVKLLTPLLLDAARRDAPLDDLLLALIANPDSAARCV